MRLKKQVANLASAFILIKPTLLTFILLKRYGLFLCACWLASLLANMACFGWLCNIKR
jgi:hypothetical protein